MERYEDTKITVHVTGKTKISGFDQVTFFESDTLNSFDELLLRFLADLDIKR